MKNSKSKTLHRVFVGLLIAFAALGSIFSGVFVSQASRVMQTNLLQEEVTTKKHSISSKLIAQLVVPPTILNPLTVCVYVPPEKPEYKGEVIVKENQISAEQGGEFEVSIYVKNTGNTVWFGDSSGCGGVNYIRLGTARDQDRNSIFFNPGDNRWLAENRIAMVEPRVEPGEIATFTFKSHAPRVNDIFREYFQPMVENTSWLSAKDTLAKVDIYVGANAWENEKSLFYLGKSGQASSIDASQTPAIFVDISDQRMLVKLGETVIREYLVSTGTFKTPTPIGTFKILNKQELRIGGAAPHYRMPKWQGFTQWGHGLHALPYLASDRGTFWTEALTHIGQRVSHGCIRLLPEDADELYNLVTVGTPVTVQP